MCLTCASHGKREHCEHCEMVREPSLLERRNRALKELVKQSERAYRIPSYAEIKRLIRLPINWHT